MEEYGKLYRIAFDFHKQFYPCPSDPDSWVKAAQEMGKASSQGGNNPFLNDLLIVIMDEMERRWKATQ